MRRKGHAAVLGNIATGILGGIHSTVLIKYVLHLLGILAGTYVHCKGSAAAGGRSMVFHLVLMARKYGPEKVVKGIIFRKLTRWIILVDIGGSHVDMLAANTLTE